MAATMAGNAGGPLARCSTCDADIDFSRLGEHVCMIATATSNTPSHVSNKNAQSIERTNSPLFHSTSQRNAHVSGKLPKFAPPARIDPFAANEAFHTNQVMTPNSFLGRGIDSPARLGSPASIARFRMPPRSATTPYFHDRPPSPDMLMPQDSAFPVFPTKKVRQEQAKRDRKRSKSMSRSQSRDRVAFQPGAGPSPNPARSASPAVTLFPGRPSTANSSSRKGSVSSLRSPANSSAFSSMPEPVPPIPMQHDASGRASPRLEGHDNSSELHNNKPDPPSGLSSPPEPESMAQQQDQQQQRSIENTFSPKQHNIAPAIKPLDAIGSTRKLNQELSLSIPRSQSSNGVNSGVADRVTPPIAEPHSAAIQRHPNGWAELAAMPEQLTSHTQIKNSPERSTISDKTEDGLGNLPSFSKPYESGFSTAANRLRTSASSDGSQYSATHSVSSRSSPPTSASSFNTQESAAKSDSIDNILDEASDLSRPTLNNEPTIPVVNSSHPHVQTSYLQQRTRAPAKSFSRPNYIRPQVETSASETLPTALASPHQVLHGQVSSPTNHVESQGGQQQSLDDRPFQQDDRSPITNPRSLVTTSPVSPADRPFSPMTPRTPQTPLTPRNGDSSLYPPRRPTTPGFKGNCRGCGEMIVGKSVSSADGRLTGRYHKQCFVCQTCKEPFQTADFYVINNQPYCQRHYHTLNGSICENCDRGIEGPYMETDARKKFHPHCFTCKECHLILRSDYFEISGVIYCEKHSRKPDLLGPGRRFPERRTTRLMMIHAKALDVISGQPCPLPHCISKGFYERKSKIGV